MVFWMICANELSALPLAFALPELDDALVDEEEDSPILKPRPAKALFREDATVWASLCSWASSWVFFSFAIACASKVSRFVFSL